MAEQICDRKGRFDGTERQSRPETRSDRAEIGVIAGDSAVLRLVEAAQQQPAGDRAGRSPDRRPAAGRDRGKLTGKPGPGGPGPCKIRRPRRLSEGSRAELVLVWCANLGRWRAGGRASSRTPTPRCGGGIAAGPENEPGMAQKGPPKTVRMIATDMQSFDMSIVVYRIKVLTCNDKMTNLYLNVAAHLLI